MQRQLPSCGHCDGEENHSKSMWDVLSFTNLPFSPPSRPESFREKVRRIAKNFAIFSTTWESTFFFLSVWPVFDRNRGWHKAIVIRGSVNSHCVFETDHVWHFYPPVIIIRDFTNTQRELSAQSVLTRAYVWPLHRRNMNNIHLFNHKPIQKTMPIWRPLISMSVNLLSFVHNKVHVD